jgi:micrococcal nuclease
MWPVALRLAVSLVLLLVSLGTHARNFEGVVTHVSDGDTIWVRPATGGPPRKVRLQGIDAPEICQPWGVQAREALAARAMHQRVKVESRRRDDYQRELGYVSIEGDDLGEWMVRGGHAWSYRYRRDHGPYAGQEAKARQLRRGLWADPSSASPRDFRKQHGSCR